MTLFSVETTPDNSSLELEGASVSPSPAEPEVAGDEMDVTRWTAEPFTPAPATAGRRPLFRT
jgi:hypothetical protein